MDDNTEIDALDEIASKIALVHPDYIDGPWHDSTIELGKQLGCNGFALNRLWVLTPFDWQCPSCKRRKSQIARKNKNGQLSGHIVYHHDHMAEYLAAQFHKFSTAGVTHLATVDGESFSKRVSPAIAAFDTVAICQDCNNADSEAKKLVGAPQHFSFTREDIGQFVSVEANLPHGICEEKLGSVWSFRKPQLIERLAVADKLAQIAAKNMQWYERAPYGYGKGEIEQGASFRLEKDGELGSDITIASVVSAFQTPTTSSPPNRQWRRKRAVAGSKPTEAELAHVANVSHPGLWAKVPDDWKCPWCLRTKVQTVRPSKSHDWSFAVHETTIIESETGSNVAVKFCKDCEKVRQGIAKDAGSSSFAKLVDPVWIQKLVLPEPHAEHALVGDEQIDEVVELLRQRSNGELGHFVD